MRLGLHCLGIGTGAGPAVIAAVARAAEDQGVATLWAGEHLVLVDEPASRYPYAADGRIAVPADADWLDPFLTLAWAGAATGRIGLATGILLLPEHHPVAVAKRAASLDMLCGGRLTLGVGVGWSAEEFAALGVPFGRRGARTADYVAALRALWRDDPAAHHGPFVDFERVRSFPKPYGGRTIPVVCGGNSPAALERVAAWGDGWYGFNVDPDDLGPLLDDLAARCRTRGRDPATLTVAVAVAVAVAPADGGAGPGAVPAGVDELVPVATPPGDPAAAADFVADLVRPWPDRQTWPTPGG